MTTHHVLLLGGFGKVAQLLTPLLLQRSWNVTSIIRNPDQVAHLEQLRGNHSGKLNVLVRSIEGVKSEAQAKTLIDEVKPDYVVWSAGAAGKGAPERVCIYYYYIFPYLLLVYFYGTLNGADDELRSSRLLIAMLQATSSGHRRQLHQ